MIEEAVALRLKSKTDQEGDSAIEVLQVLEQPDEQERLSAIREQIEAEAQQQARSRFEMLEFGLKQKIAHLEAQLAKFKPSELVSSPSATGLQDVLAPEATLESTAFTVTYDAVASEPVAATGLQPSSCDRVALASNQLNEDPDLQVAELALEQPSEHSGSPTETADDYLEPVAEPNPQPSDEASTISKQPLAADWDMLQQLRAAEGYIQKIDTQIRDFTSKLASPGLDRAVERELKGLLANRQKLRTTKIFQIVSFADSNAIPVNYGQLRDQGRVVLVPEYASALLRQAKSWADVVLVSGSDLAQLINAIKDSTIESRQLLVHLLSAYLESEPSALSQIDWIPKKLLTKALSTLTFKIRKIGGSNNLVDEPKIEYISCDFVSLEQTGTDREQWIFRDSNNNNHAVFGRDCIETIKFSTET